MRSALFVLAILFFCGCLYGAKQQPSAVTSTAPENETALLQNDLPEYDGTVIDCDSVHTLERGLCYWQKAIRSRNASLCGFIQQGERDYCYGEVAIGLNETSACSLIECAGKRQVCISRITQSNEYADNFNCSYGCSKEGEYVSSEAGDVMYPSECCAGLTAWWSGSDSRIAVDDACYDTNAAGDRPVGVCIRCGDGVCSDLESVCNCPEDCKGKKSSMTAAQFCRVLYNRYCSDEGNILPVCRLC